MATSRRAPGCEHCEPIDLSDVAQIFGLSDTYARKLATEGRILAPDGMLGKTRWWWRHRVEAAHESGRYTDAETPS